MSVCRIIARSFSSSSTAQQLVKTPIQVFGVEGRYASALYSAASKQKSLETVEKDLVKLEGLLKSDKQFDEFVKNPLIKRRHKAEGLKAVSAKISLNTATANLLTLLAENGRLNKVGQVISTYKLLMSANRGEVICEVITAKPLDADIRGKLEGALKAFVKQNQKILLTTKVDPSIIGGMIVSVGDQYVDMSISSKIKKYTELITAAA